MATTEFVEGWSDPVDFTLLADGVAINLTGITVSLVATNAKTLTPLTVAGSVSVPNAAAGQVRYSPVISTDALFLETNSPVRIRWKLTDGTNRVRYVPNQKPDQWVIRQP